MTQLREYKSYEFVPMDEWPGEDVTEQDVWLASLDDRDWFSHESRLQAFYDYKNRLDFAWRRRQRGRWVRNYPPPKFDFAQIGVVGDMGKGKTTIVASEAVYYGQFGYPFFSVYNPENMRTSWLMGKKVSPAELYEVIEVIPQKSILGVDEGHTFFESALGMASGIRGWQIQGAGLRKALCRVYIPTALMVLLAPVIRRSCSEVWRPVQTRVDDHRVPEDRLPPHSDPVNFLQVWDVWRGFPFRQKDIIEARAPRRNGGLGAAPRHPAPPRRDRARGLQADRLVPAGGRGPSPAVRAEGPAGGGAGIPAPRAGPGPGPDRRTAGGAAGGVGYLQ